MTPSQAAEGVVSEERLEHLAVMHFNIDFLPDRQEFIDIQIALRELQHLRRLSTQNTEGWVSVKDRLPEPFVDVWCATTLGTVEKLRRVGKGEYWSYDWSDDEITHWMPQQVKPAPPTLASRDVP